MFLLGAEVITDNFLFLVIRWFGFSTSSGISFSIHHFLQVCVPVWRVETDSTTDLVSRGCCRLSSFKALFSLLQATSWNGNPEQKLAEYSEVPPRSSEFCLCTALFFWSSSCPGAPAMMNSSKDQLCLLNGRPPWHLSGHSLKTDNCRTQVHNDSLWFLAWVISLHDAQCFQFVHVSFCFFLKVHCISIFLFYYLFFFEHVELFEDY